MDALFGVSMTLIMFVLVGVLVTGLASIGLIALRNPVMFRIGVRNIPRRRAQTILIVLGLMLSTLIVSAAFTTGDTVDRSLTSQVYRLLGEVDELVVVGGTDDPTFADESQGITREVSFSASEGAAIAAILANSPDIEAVVPGYADVAVAVNEEQRLSSPVFTLMGLDAATVDGLGDLRSVVTGDRVRVADLAPGEFYLNESGAEDLDAGVGDSLLIFAFGGSYELRVRDVVEDRRLAGSVGISIRREGGVVPLAVAQALFEAPGQLTFLAVSNTGDARGGVAHADAALAAIGTAIELREVVPLAVHPTKADAVDLAEQGANFMATFFLVLGLFSIGAGVLLVFMIFVMLAAERKSEMGMARAIGTRRRDIVQMFLSEGMIYNLMAALVGAALGVGVAFVIGRIMGAIFAEFDLEISPHVTVRSLVISYCLGGAVTFLTVTFSSFRVSVLNIVRAIRDIPEPPTPRPQWRRRNLLRTFLALVFKPGSKRQWAARLGLLVVVFFLQGGAAAAEATAVQALVGTLAGLLFVLFVFLSFRPGPLFVAVSIPLIALGTSEQIAAVLLLGLSLLPLGLALLARSFGANERLSFTTAGLILLYIWEFDFFTNFLEKIFGQVEGDIELFFLSGVMVTVAATFLVVYNADILLAVLTRMGDRLGALLPSIKMAVAYPLANRMRTGLTMAMFTLVVFALVMMSAMNYNFDKALLSDAAQGGWDVVVDENPTNRIEDLEGGLTAAGSPVVDEIDAVGVSSMVTSFNAELCQIRPGEACAAAAGDWGNYQVRGVDDAYLATSEIKLQYRAAGYETEAAVWAAVAADPSLAVIDVFALPGNAFDEVDFLIRDFEEKDGFAPVPLRLKDPRSNQTHDLSVIGVARFDVSAAFFGLHVREDIVTETFGGPDFRRYYVKLLPGADPTAAAREIESAFLTTGAQAASIRDQIEEQNGVFRSFFYLMQGFMGLGLFVGVAAVGVIAFRTVVERRQQIGMLRALGYTRRMIGLTFLIESAFIAFMGIASGIVFALILAWQLVDEELSDSGISSFLIPWSQIAIIGGLAFGFALLMTLVPSRQAAGIPIASALRYE